MFLLLLALTMLLLLLLLPGWHLRAICRELARPSRWRFNST
jgi:hypothetical protein